MNLLTNVLLMIVLPMVAGLCAWLLEQKKGATPANLFATAVAAVQVLLCALLWGHLGETAFIPVLAGFGFHFQVTGFQLVLSSLACFLWFMTTGFCSYYFHGHHGVGRYQLFSFLTLGSIIGVFVSADFFTLLFFFEIMSVTSWVTVIHEQTPNAIDAAASYLGFAVIGGLCTMMGLFLLQHIAGTLVYTELSEIMPGVPHNALLYTAGILVVFGFAAKAGMWPLHTWLPAAHPAAPATASALLSGIITKAGVFGICATSVSLFLTDFNWGMGLLCFGVITMFTGAVLAIFSIDLKRTLACSSMSQIGFIIVGIAMQRLLGEESTIAVYGSVLHVCNHSTLKLCLFLCAGVLVHCCHSRDLNDLKGFGRGKWAFLLAFTMGYLGITCMPLFGGYVSKTLLHESILEYVEILHEEGQSIAFMKGVEYLFLCSGGFTMAYMTKLFVALFFEKNSDPAKQAKMDAMNRKYIGAIPAAILLAAGLVSPIFGCFPHQTMDQLANLSLHFFDAEPMHHAVHYFAWANLKGAVITVVIGGVTYFGFIRTVLIRGGKYIDIWPKKLDLERSVYRPLLLNVLPFIGAFCARLLGSIFDWIVTGCGVLLRKGNHDLGRDDVNDTFAVYPKDMDGTRGTTATLAYGMMLAGLVIMVCFAYVLLRL